MIVNEFECFVLFPAAPIFLFFASCVVAVALLYVDLSKKNDDEDEDFNNRVVLVLLPVYFFFFYFLLLSTQLTQNMYLILWTTTKDTWSGMKEKIQLCAWESKWVSERVREKERRIVEWEKIMLYTRSWDECVFECIRKIVQKSHFYSCLAPFHLAHFVVVTIACLPA